MAQDLPYANNQTDIAPDCCETSFIHEEAVRTVRERMPAPEVTQAVADFFRVMSDPTRMRILCALGQSELCVCDLAALLGMSESAVSHQLRTLRAARVVRTRREGRIVYYALDDHHVRTAYKMGEEHVLEVL
ncbi:MAG: metalloregulator ArsR/SmtB family transcription factor [Bacillota bacterium]|nr:metalloregulator ArsR/SmtB family transcription factor [Bacillota bacterium]